MNWIKRLPAFEAALVTVILVIHAYAALSDAYNMPNAWFTRDDAYYYFKVAQNITEGHGVSFDGINPTNGYHPLWMLVCIPIFALARFDLILPLRVLLMFMAALNAVTSVALYRLLRRAFPQPIAIVSAVFWAFNAYIHYTVYEFGLETPLAALGVVLLVNQLSKLESEWRTREVKPRQVALTAAIATLMMFSRLDLVFLAAIAGLWLVFRGHPMRFLLPLDLVAIFGAMVVSFALRTGFPNYYLFVNTAVLAALLALAIKIPILYFAGLYQHPRSISVSRMLLNTALALLAGAVILFALLFILTQTGLVQGFPRAALAYDLGLSLALILASRLSAGWFGSRTVKSSLQTPVNEFRTQWKTWLADGVIYYGILGGALSIYMLYNRMVFGTSSPVSGQIKRWWGSMVTTVYDGPPYEWTAFLGISYQWVYDAWQPASNFFIWIAQYLRPLMRGSNMPDERYYLAMILVAASALFVFLLNPGRVRNTFTKLGILPLLAGSGIHILYYTTTGYAGAKEWYWISQMVLVTLLGASLLDLIARPLAKFQAGRAVVATASALASLYLVYLFVGQVIDRMPYNYFPPDRPYMEVLPFLEENTPPGSVIGMTGGGNVGYFIHDRTIVNMDGLINSYEYFQSLQSGEAPIYLRQKGMDIIFANPGLLNLPPYNGQFAAYVERFGDYGGKALLYLLEKPKY